MEKFNGMVIQVEFEELFSVCFVKCAVNII